MTALVTLDPGDALLLEQDDLVERGDWTPGQAATARSAHRVMQVPGVRLVVEVATPAEVRAHRVWVCADLAATRMSRVDGSYDVAVLAPDGVPRLLADLVDLRVRPRLAPVVVSLSQPLLAGLADPDAAGDRQLVADTIADAAAPTWAAWAEDLRAGRWRAWAVRSAWFEDPDEDAGDGAGEDPVGRETAVLQTPVGAVRVLEVDSAQSLVPATSTEVWIDLVDLLPQDPTARLGRVDEEPPGGAGWGDG